MKDDLGDRMKGYEKLETSKKVSGPFVYARIDGRGFSKFTKGLDKPFDLGLQSTMVQVTKALVQKTHAITGYTQSDEISLVWDAEKIFFDGKIQKLSSILASMATSHFIIEGWDRIPPSFLLERFPHFDARVFSLPDIHEVTNAFLWRYKDAYRNSISMIGQANFSHKKLNLKSQKDVKDMLAEIGIFENDFSKSSIHGTAVVREKILHTTDEGAEFYRDKVIAVSAEAFGTSTHEERIRLVFGDRYDNRVI